jgi:hypothetical protein
MKTTMDKSALAEELKTFGITDDKEIQHILQNLPDEGEVLKPEDDNQKGIQQTTLARVEYGQGNPSNPIAVYIVNLQGRVVNVAYSRTVDGGSTSYGNISLQPYQRHFVGYHCITATYTSLCSRNITTRINQAS